MESVRRQKRLDISLDEHSFNKENVSKSSNNYKILSEKSLNSSYIQRTPSKSPKKKPTLNLNNLSYCPATKGLVSSPISPITKSFYLSPCSNHIQLPLGIYHRERREIKKPYSNEFCYRSPFKNRTPSVSPARLKKNVREKSPLQIPKLEINKAAKNEDDTFSSKICESVDNGEWTFNPSILSSRCDASPRCIEDQEKSLSSISYTNFGLPHNLWEEGDCFKNFQKNIIPDTKGEPIENIENDINFSEMKTQRRNENSDYLSSEIQQTINCQEAISYSPKYKVINSDDFLNALKALIKRDPEV